MRLLQDDKSNPADTGAATAGAGTSVAPVQASGAPGEGEDADPRDPWAAISARIRVASFMLTGLFVLAASYTLHYAKDILMPVAAAVVLALVFMPVVRGLRRIKVPEPVAAAVMVLGFFAAIVAAVFFLAGPATKWISDMPEMVSEIRDKFEEPLSDIKNVKAEVENIVKETEGGPDTPPGPAAVSAGQDKADPQGSPTPVRVTLFDVFSRVFEVTRDVGWSVVIVFVMLYFLLATGSMFRDNVIVALPSWRDKRRALAVARDIERDISTYLATVTLINIGLGVAIGAAMHAIGLPNAVLWAVMAALLNFVPYLGAMVGSAVVLTIGLVSFDSPAQAMLPPAIYIAINAFEAYLVTPAILSRRLTINPIAVFLSVIFWGWIWGVPGALMAVPILACLKVICDATRHMTPLSQFLNGRRLR